MEQHVSGKHCPICLHSITYTPIDCEYIRCPKCGVVRTKYGYNPTQYGTTYAKNYLAYAESPCNQSLNLFRLGLISRWILDSASILDIGCCVGEFIRFAEKYYSCEGFEPNQKAAIEARKRVNSRILPSLNGNGPYQCITMFDVLEHIAEPADFLKHCSSILSGSGIIALTTPNVGVIPKSSDDMLRTWKHYKAQEHLFLHTENSLETLFNALNFEIVHWGREESDIRPGNPDGDILTCVARKKP